MKYESPNGRIFTCASCRKIHLEFNNFALDLKDTDALRELCNYLKAVLSALPTGKNEQQPDACKTVIPFHTSNIKLLANAFELHEIIGLINGFSGLNNLEFNIPLKHKNIPSSLLNGISYLQLN
ncbi:MAG: DUF6686 family protein [Mangrovibacterium sp.]